MVNAATLSTRRPPVWLSRRDAAEECRVSESTIKRRIADGSLPAYRIGGQVRVKASDLDKLARRIPTVVAR